MEYCTKCGTEIDEDQLFCSNCGSKKITLDQRSNETQNSEEFRSRPLTTQPPPRYSTYNPQPIGKTIHSNFVETNEYQNFKTSCIVFALAPIIIFVLGMFQFDEITTTFISSIVTAIGFGALALGIYSFKNINKLGTEKEMRKSANLLMLFAGLNIVANNLVIFLPSLSGTITIQGLRDYTQQGIFIMLFGFVVSIVLLIGTISFTKWFDEFSLTNQLQMTSRVKWVGILNAVGNGLLLLAIIFLFQLIYTIDPTSTISVIGMIGSSLALLALASVVSFAAIVMQVLAGYKIYNILRELEDRVKYQSYNQQRDSNYY